MNSDELRKDPTTGFDLLRQAQRTLVGDAVRDDARTSMRRHPNSARFHELVQEISELHDHKQMDYGAGDDPFANVRASLDWGIAPWVGALVRLNDKVKRLQNFAQKGELANESAEDSMRDIAVYALIALVLYEGEAGG